MKDSTKPYPRWRAGGLKADHLLNRIWASEGVKGQDELALFALDSHDTIFRLELAIPG
mgnify:CR=1 FL=1